MADGNHECSLSAVMCGDIWPADGNMFWIDLEILTFESARALG